MEERSIRTTLVCGFLDAGKTSYIQDCIFHDFFHKRGTTLILVFEEGECEYNTAALREYRTEVAVYEGGEDITAFCLAQIEKHAPDRVYVEMNAMTEGLREKLPACLKIVFTVTLADGATLDLYLRNMRQLMQNTVAASDVVQFNRVPRREMLDPYSQLFRLMNRRASYLWEAPQGYHEKAFDLFVPYDLDRPVLEIGEREYIPFVLDAAAHPAHYDGKEIRLTAQTAYTEQADGADVFLGRTVMTCCLADLQFLGVPADGITQERFAAYGWAAVKALGTLKKDRYGLPRLRLIVREAEAVPAPEKLMLQASDL